MKVLIYGAGSIGNHLSQAARTMLWDVTVVDNDQVALERMQNDIYPGRYGAWDELITLVHADQFGARPGEYDIIMIGTPPDLHLALASDALRLGPKILHIEKPLCAPGDDFESFVSECHAHPEVMVTVGYDHAVAPSFRDMCSAIANGSIGKVLAIDALTREHWDGIFKAHPWQAGPHESYLGYWQRGGGALCEHSHALHLGLVVAEACQWSDLSLEAARLDICHGPHGENYDQRSDLIIAPTSKNGTLRVTQDVITRPTQKEVSIVGERGQLQLSLSPTLDQISRFGPDGVLDRIVPHEKNRPKDFYYLVRHYDALLNGRISIKESPLCLAMGVQVMKLIQKSFSHWT